MLVKAKVLATSTTVNALTIISIWKLRQFNLFIRYLNKCRLKKKKKKEDNILYGQILSISHVSRRTHCTHPRTYPSICNRINARMYTLGPKAAHVARTTCIVVYSTRSRPLSDRFPTATVYSCYPKRICIEHVRRWDSVRPPKRADEPMCVCALACTRATTTPRNPQTGRCRV